MAINPTKKEIQELRYLEKGVLKPKLEEKMLPLIKNKYKPKGKGDEDIIEQYKINIPKKFSDFLKLNKEKFRAKAILDKENNKIIFEVFENE